MYLFNWRGIYVILYVYLDRVPFIYCFKRKVPSKYKYPNRKHTKNLSFSHAHNINHNIMKKTDQLYELTPRKGKTMDMC